MSRVVATSQTILVVSSGISGMTAALVATECGKDIVLIEKSATLGGSTTLLNRYFCKLCHPTRSFGINLRRLKANPRLRVLTLAYDGRAKEADLDAHVIRPRKLEETAVKVVMK